jgi:mono/diheme cytochrome c family protein
MREFAPDVSVAAKVRTRCSVCANSKPANLEIGAPRNTISTNAFFPFRISAAAFLRTACRIGVLLCAALSLASLARAQEGGRGPALPEGDGKQLVTVVCSQCHGLRQTQILRDGQNGWQETVNRMVLYGAQVTPSEAATITHYLATQLGPGTGTMASGALPPQNALGNAKVIALPDGPGKELVSVRCILCHDLERVVSSTRSKADWDAITTNMVGRGLKATPDELQSMTAYLSSHFGK